MAANNTECKFVPKIIYPDILVNIYHKNLLFVSLRHQYYARYAFFPLQIVLYGNLFLILSFYVIRVYLIVYFIFMGIQ
jgi:hypothetical protein